MRIKNKDGTINSIPICIIFTVLAVVAHFFIFGFNFNKSSNSIIGTDNKATTTTTTKPNSSIDLCNDCSIRFRNDTVDVSTNGDVDLSSLIILDKTTIQSVSFTSSDPQVVKISPSGGSYHIVTSNLEGKAIITAKAGDNKVELIVNVIHPSKASVKFKYDYYFVSKSSGIYPEIETYPLGINLGDIKFSVNTKDIVYADGKKSFVKGNKTGEAIYSLETNGMKASTKIYSVPNLITIKVNSNGQYKQEREITPSGSSFEIIIQFEDKNRDNYDNSNLNISFDQNDLNARVTYSKRHNALNSYIYQVDNISGTGKSIMRVELPDGSFTLFEINK